jgi:hypothetical protein
MLEEALKNVGGGTEDPGLKKKVNQLEKMVSL